MTLRRWFPLARLLAASTALAVLAPVFSETPPVAPKPGDPNYNEEVTVRVGEIQVLVTDKDNHPMTGLKPEEVEVREGGTPCRVAFVEPFATKDLAVRLLPQATPLIPLRGTPGATPEPTTINFPAPKPMRRYVLLFDGYNSRTQDRARWVKGATDWVKTMKRPDDEIAIATVEKGTVKTIQNFTTDKDVLLSMLQTPGFMPPGDYHDYASDITEILGNLTTCDNALSKLQCSMNAATPVVNELSNRTQATINALRQFVAMLAPIPGRKLVLFISNGIVIDPGQIAGMTIMSKLGMEQMSYNSAQNMFQTRFYGDLLELGRVAAASNASFFTFDTRNSARRSGLGDVDQRVINDMAGTIDPYALMFDMTRGTLDTISSATGGRAMHGPQIEKNLPAAAESVEGLYTVGYYREPGNRSTKVKVKIARKGAEVTYVDRFDPLRQMPQVVRLDIGIGRPRPFESMVEVPVIAQIPADDITFKSTEGSWIATVGLYVEAVSPDGHRAASQYETVEIQLDSAAYDRRTGRKFEHALPVRVPPGPYRIRVRASDAAFKHAAERAVDVTVKADYTVAAGIQNSVTNQNSGRPPEAQPAGPTGNSTVK